MLTGYIDKYLQENKVKNITCNTYEIKVQVLVAKLTNYARLNVERGSIDPRSYQFWKHAVM
ncbi:hypothetical protein DSM106972_067630 [Dulcicalothrix desertica PCC 7102]|uniref:Uncharacterized protein n=1 Tax=Dulcicalothrix desertica PCC 7102 TaxID=232991 RepID=A0A433V536_9CYAN|nr:hypothetical protein [Dulcicalothrix desertica]RUT01212.1 hypothetical protein DSM106972_067630 [Dulcicalothrix desertica PCC 7102]TWH40637.1 hypothetical protein CAL7102_09981 [Dulcicalothrix desertica PCC 7102]